MAVDLQMGWVAGAVPTPGINPDVRTTGSAATPDRAADRVERASGRARDI